MFFLCACADSPPQPQALESSTSSASSVSEESPQGVDGGRAEKSTGMVMSTGDLEKDVSGRGSVGGLVVWMVMLTLHSRTLLLGRTRACRG